MDLASIRKDAFAMPVHNPAYLRPQYRFLNREYFIISYETDLDDALKQTVDGEFTTVEGFANTVAFVAGFESAVLTGQSLIVSHGWSMH